MNDLGFYGFLDRIGLRNYRAKIMVVAFIGTHIPLISLVAYVASKSSSDWPSFFITLGITLAATLIGTAITLVVLHLLLKPVVKTSRVLRDYVESRRVGALPTAFTDEVGTLMADTARSLAHLERVRETLEHTDLPTGLPNRGKFLRDHQGASNASEPCAVCVIRFSNYGKLAETFDLKAADAAAAEMAARCGRALRDGQALYRVSAHDFVWLAKGGAAHVTPAALEIRMREIVSACEGDMAIGDLAVRPELFTGVAFFPDDAESVEAALDRAISAAAEGMLVSFHSPSARSAALNRLKTEVELRRAIERDEFVLHYQPVVDLAAGKVVGAEALIRWNHPEKGLVAPGAFIGVAETTGLIDPIGLWVLRTASRQIKEWNASGLSGVKVAVNVSARQFLDADLVNHVAEAVNAAGIDPSQLEIELTETAAMGDHARTKAVFTRLRDTGVSIAIDDFGCGYASMSYLRKLPFDKLKIDREFVTQVHANTGNQAICRALISLADGLGLKLLAEGTEKSEEVQYLQRHGCNLYQGFYFSKPIDSVQFSQRAPTLLAQRLPAAA